MIRYKHLLSLCLLIATAPPLCGTDLSQPLTSEEVLCDAQQLNRLAARSVVSEIDPQKPELASNPMLFLWRHSFGGGSYGLLAVTDGVRPLKRDERQLSAELVLSEEGDVLDPRRPLLTSATLTRRNQNSNIATSLRDFLLTITMDAAPEVPDPSRPKIPLIVNNLGKALRGDQPRQAADTVGRGLAGDNLTRPCHSKLTDFDEKIFRVLARSLRISRWFTLTGYNPADPTAWNIVLFRGQDPNFYKATIHGYYVTCLDDNRCPFYRNDPADLEIIVNWNVSGQPTTGEIRLVPRAHSGQLGIFLLPPLRPGRDRQTSELNDAPFLRFESLDSPRNILVAPVDWEALLASSRWND